MKVRNRVVISIVLVATSVLLAMVAVLIPASTETDQAQGTVIDFGSYNTTWTNADLSGFGTTLDLLKHACSENSYSLTLTDNGTIMEINGDTSGDNGRQWDLWVVMPGDTGWTLLKAPYTQDPTRYTVISWAYRAEGEVPTVAVDAAGNPIYGFQQIYRLVSLSPTVTEIVASIGAENILVGADYYSNYPESVVASKASGAITMVGTYTNPSFEVIIDTYPDMILCDGGQYSHFQMAIQLRNVGLNSIILYSGMDMGSIMDNIFIVGQVIGYDIAVEQVIEETEYVFDTLSSVLQGYADGSLNLMVALESNISPWVAGGNTYMDEILGTLSSNNVFSGWSGWVHITSDMITQQNPDVIIIITAEYTATQEEYNYLYSHLSAQWQSTDAWKEGRIYMVCESAAEMFQRYGPRTVHVVELMAMMLYPDAFGTEVPMYIGDDYRDYLTHSKDMSV